MNKITVLVNKVKREAVFSEKYYDKMRKFGEVCVFDKDDFSDRDYYLDFVKGSTIIITSWGTPAIDKDVLDRCPNLKAVMHAAGSIKPVLTDELIATDVRLTNGAAAIGEGVAETALGLSLAACKGFVRVSRLVADGLWSAEINDKEVIDFYDLKVGVISGGYVGRHMVKLLKNFHVDILMYDPILSKEEIEKIGATKVELDELMSQCDVVSVHAPSIPATDDMLNKNNLCLLKDRAVLVNTSRGSVINEADLIEELKKNRIFACIDVTKPEPPAPDNVLRNLPNVLMTSHIAGTCTNGLKRIALHICEELERLENGEKMRTEVDKSKLSQLA